MNTIKHNGITYIDCGTETGVHGNKFKTLQAIGKRGQPLKRHYLAPLKSDGTISTVQRWI